MQVYLTINIENGKMYIGKDTRSRKSYLGSGSLLKKAVEKYGRDSFIKVILSDNINCQEELSKEEMKFISIFDAVKSDRFYNISSGEESWGFELGREIFQFSKDGIFIKRFASLESACKEFKGSKGNLCKAASGERNYWKNFRWSYTETPNEIRKNPKGRKKGTMNSYKIKRNHCNIKNVKINCYEDGIFLKTFENREDAAKYFNSTSGSINQYVISGRIYRKKYTFERGEEIKKTIYKTDKN